MKPFPRLDKFREHFTKHEGPEKFLCFIETCRHGPLTRPELQEHLATRHFCDYHNQPHLGDYFTALPFLGTRSNDGSIRHGFALFHVGQKRFKGKDACPLGCKFRLSFKEPSMESHLNSHDLKDCLEAEAEIASTYRTYNYRCYQATCPICNEVCSQSGVMFHLLRAHSKAERLKSASEFCRRYDKYIGHGLCKLILKELKSPSFEARL
jgi:hypothetical protein